MEPAGLKARFGDRLTFWGGAIDSQHVLPRATPETVREEVRRNLELWKPGGGYGGFDLDCATSEDKILDAVQRSDPTLDGHN